MTEGTGSETERAVVETARRFAADILHPVGRKLDRLGPSEVIAPDSDLWMVHREYRRLGLHLFDIASELTPQERVRLEYLVNEELGWGDVGLGWSCYASVFPAMLAAASGDPVLREQFNFDQIGCWGITEPDHGTDMLDFTHKVSVRDSGTGRGNCLATRRGDKIVLRGQKSAWVSNGSIAETMSLFCRYDDGSGRIKRAAFLVNLNQPNVRRARPIDKLGARTLTDAEIFFDEVEIDARNMVCPPEAHDATVEGIILHANPGMAVFLVGLARRAFEVALAYSKERVQGGQPIFEYQLVRMKLFEMFRKIEAARALARHASEQLAGPGPHSLPLAVSAKVTGTQTAIEVANAAFDVFGGAGITKEYPVEKLVRDARMGTIADGTNDVLSLMAASRL